MLSRGLEQFCGKRILLLQGPVGPFFARLAKDLRAAGAVVYKVNFNSGDWLYYPRHAFNYRGTMEEWPQWFEALVARLGIEVVFLYGDCRPVHSVVHGIAMSRGLDIGVFEEGYLRPNHITLERFGVNGFSRIPKDPAFYRAQTLAAVPERQVGNTYWPLVWHSFCYHAAAILGRFLFGNYCHHRPLTIAEAFPWVRSLWRKIRYTWAERGLLRELIQQHGKSYYLVPLQVFNDAQVRVHAHPQDISQFIESTARSFAQHAPKDTVLVFKHHPMDRGYSDYARLIGRLAVENGIAARLYYLHDQHLPTLLENARGVVVINSTVGMSALLHGIPTKNCAVAIYDMPGLTFQGSLDEFWGSAQGAGPDKALYAKFRTYLIAHTQLNGSYYRRIDSAPGHAAVLWHGTRAQEGDKLEQNDGIAETKAEW